MLSDETLEKLSQPIIDNVEKVNQYVLQQIGSTLKQIGKLDRKDAYKLEQVFKYGGDYQKIVRILSKITKINQKQIKKLFEQAAKKDYQFAKQFYDYRNKKYIPYQQNTILKNQVEAIAEQTAKSYSNLSNTTVIGFQQTKNKKVVFKRLKQVYEDIIDQGIFAISQGKQTYDDFLTNTIKQLGSGLRVVYPTTYIGKDGKKHHYTRRLDSAVKMNLKDGLRQLHNETQKIIGQQFDADGVEITVHSNPAPDHELVQGKQFSNEQFENFQNDDTAVSYDGVVFLPEFEGHDRRSISEYNCYHYTFAIILGVNKPQYSNEQLQEIIDKNNNGFEFEGKHYTNYEGTQLQRRIETEIRNTKDQQILARASQDFDEVEKAQNKISILTRKYKKISEASKLPTKPKRMKVSQYRRINVSNLI